MTEGAPGALSVADQALEFAQELGALLSRTLPSAPNVNAEFIEDRAVVRPDEAVPVLVAGERLASLEVHLRCMPDHRGEWLAVESSTFKVSLDVDRTPLLRIEFLRSPHTAPSAHLQIHAQRGALTHLLSKAGHGAPHEMSKLHFPLGGARYRPCLEDVIQFLISECRVDSLPNWEDAVCEGRETWRRKQARAVARDFPTEAAETLKRLGYSVTAPPEVPPTAERALHHW